LEAVVEGLVHLAGLHDFDEMGGGGFVFGGKAGGLVFLGDQIRVGVSFDEGKVFFVACQSILAPVEGVLGFPGFAGEQVGERGAVGVAKLQGHFKGCGGFFEEGGGSRGLFFLDLLGEGPLKDADGGEKKDHQNQNSECGGEAGAVDLLVGRPG